MRLAVQFPGYPPSRPRTRSITAVSCAGEAHSWRNVRVGMQAFEWTKLIMGVLSALGKPLGRGASLDLAFS